MWFSGDFEIGFVLHFSWAGVEGLKRLGSRAGSRDDREGREGQSPQPGTIVFSNSLFKIIREGKGKKRDGLVNTQIFEDKYRLGCHRREAES